ncbi:MAG: radical SAM protein [bacterium]|jgi:putative pyruvate formate lyase activating enzyme|nr:radical SAM protein [candidate division KSB1 bacterium]MDH7559733.1 radical SAM protein [bacterium]
MEYRPSYLALYERGKLEERIVALRAVLRSCALCARRCGVDRLAGEVGYCKAGKAAVVSSAFPHCGEEVPLVGMHGSGTIFLAHCNLRCVFCQNWEISHGGEGREVSPQALAEMMLALQRAGCHNINFVTPTHFVPQIVEALPLAIQGGLNVPLVYNCGGYEAVETIRLLEGIFDIYMPDAKFGDQSWAARYCDAPDYFAVNKQALREMHRQVGELKVDALGIAYRGLLIRHLVIPNGVAGSEAVLRFIVEELSADSYVNIMAQYRPCYRAHQFPEIARAVSPKEVAGVIALARRLGLHRGFEEYRGALW